MINIVRTEHLDETKIEYSTEKWKEPINQTVESLKPSL